MHPSRASLIGTLLALALSVTAQTQVQAQDAGQLNVICSVQAEWCNMIQTVFAKTTGIKVNLSLKGSGEALAQLMAERANPKTDVWFGGTGGPHLQAAESGLSLAYKSAALPQLHAWAQQQAQQSGYMTVGISVAAACCDAGAACVGGCLPGRGGRLDRGCAA